MAPRREESQIAQASTILLGYDAELVLRDAVGEFCRMSLPLKRTRALTELGRLEINLQLVAKEVEDIKAHMRARSSFRVTGEPVSWKRPRRGQGGGKQWRFTDPKVRNWQEQIGQQWMVAGRPTFEGAVSVELNFVLTPAASTKREFPRQDCDNLAKCVLDALNGLSYKDDSQITRLSITKEYGSPAGVLINFSQ